ncbi:MAG: hypothetical protein V4611_04445 [Patescibacteria group bacterium]
MFKKIVSQLSFSPALVGQLSFYAKRLKKEQTTRRLGLVFVALALVVQSLVVFQAPESANASNGNDFIPGGLGTGSSLSLNNFLGPYDQNTRNLKDIFNYAGITREEIAASQLGQFTIGNKKSYGYETRAGSTTIPITNSAGQVVTTIYGRPLTIWGNSPTDQTYAYIGYSAKAGWFAILQVCGNLVTDEYLTPPPPPPAPAKITATKTAVNVTQGNVDATKTTAKVNDKITFKLTATNTGGTAKDVEFSDNLTDTLSFSKLTDNGGGTINSTTKVLSWPTASIAPGATVTKSFTVQMNSSLETSKTDCKIVNTFTSSTVTVPVGCTLPPANVVLSKTAKNISQGNIDATSVTAKENDRITFTLTAENKGGSAKEVTFTDMLGDTLEYSKLLDNGGGTFNETTRTLSWPAVSLKANSKEVRTFTVQILAAIPATPKGQSDPSSYDCRIENVYGNDIIINVTCPYPKVIEQVVPELPHTGPRENMIFAGIVLGIAVFFYYRSKQLGTEVRLIRRDLNGGSI